MSTLNCPGCGSPFFLGDEYCGNCFYNLREIAQVPASAPETVSADQQPVDPFAGSSAGASPGSSIPSTPVQETSAVPLPVFEPPRPSPPTPPVAAGQGGGELVCVTCNQTFSADARACTTCGGPLYYPCPHPNCVDKITGKTTLNPVGAKFCKTGGKKHPLTGPVTSVARPDPVQQASVLPGPSAPLAQAATVYLVILDRNGREAQRFRLKAGTNQVGAGSPGENIHPDVNLRPLDPDDYISRRHAVLEVHPGGITLTSLTQTNFTEMDGQKLQANVPMRVTDSSMIRFSHLTAKIMRG